MDFKQTTIAPAGRNKYGNYMSSGNITKSVVSTTYAGNDTTTTIGDTGGTTEDQPIYFYCMLSTPNFTFNAVDLANTITTSTQVIAYRGYDKAYTYVCDMESVTAVTEDDTIVSLTAPANQGIIGIPDGMSVSFTNNGTSASTIVFTVNSSLTGDSGSIFIPVQVYKRDDDIPLPDDLYSWYEHTYNILSGSPVSTNNCEQVWLEYTWYANRASSSGGTGPQGPSGESAWYLTLTNDNATVNCDADGNVLSGATKPSCQARLYYGSSRRTSVTYQVDCGTASGVTSGVSNGILTIATSANTFNFTGNTLAISISGTSSGHTEVKTMNITKSYPGENGEPAVSYWLETSYGSVIYNPNNQLPNPPAITVSGFMQVGQGEVESATAATFQYKFHKRSVDSFTQASSYTTSIAITSADCVTYDRLRVIMYIGQAQVDQEDVDIMTDGVNGAPGEGRQGPAIRGPYDYAEVSASTRCWCAGESGSSCSECEKWVDVILKDDVYYYCNKTYYGGLAPWTGTGGVSSAWTSGDSFDFVATKVLLASAASINFLTNNWLYLRDQNGDIVGGARGSSAGTIFWAGSEDPDDGDTPFRVDLEGNIYAQKGVFAGFVQFPYTFVSELPYSASNYTYYADGRAYLVSDTYTNSPELGVPANFVLPTPTSGLNGFTYDIIVEPSLSRMDGNQQLFTTASGGSDIYCYAYAELRVSSAYTLTGGRYQITCMPKRQNQQLVYRWAITQATGGIEVNATNTEFVSTLLGTSYDTPSLVNKVVTYTGTKPSTPSTGNTMYVKL